MPIACQRWPDIGRRGASADVGSTSKKGEANLNQPIDRVLLALTLSATFVARSFSGDKGQLVPILKAGLRHNGFALIDIISPCASFNDHEGSTKSYAFTREHEVELAHVDFVPLRKEISVDTIAEGGRRRDLRGDARWERAAVPEPGGGLQAHRPEQRVPAREGVH